MVKSYLDDLIQALLVTHVVLSFKVSKLALEEEDGYIRAKCKLSNGDFLEFAEYIQVHGDKVRIETYSFHWQTADGRLVKRWDNVGHHKDLDTYPHHLHLPDGILTRSKTMTLKKVLTDIEKLSL